LASFDEGQRQLHWELWRTKAALQKEQKRTAIRRAVQDLKQALRKAPYYNVVSRTLKTLTKRAA
jgi:hypothetical protein